MMLQHILRLIVLCKMGMYLAAQAVVLKFIKNRGDVRGKRTKFLGPLAIVQFGRGQGAEAKKNHKCLPYHWCVAP